MKICIAGGGLAGLSLGYNLKGEVEFEVIEKEGRVGGLLRSEEVEGYTFDTGAGGGGGKPPIKDSDGDGLPDSVEKSGWTIYVKEIGSSKKISIHVTSDPTKKDTDGDGINDNDEFYYGTNPRKKDTDRDGLTDRQELKHYNTDPTNWCTFNDGVDDDKHFNHWLLLGYFDGDNNLNADARDLIDYMLKGLGNSLYPLGTNSQEIQEKLNIVNRNIRVIVMLDNNTPYNVQNRKNDTVIYKFKYEYNGYIVEPKKVVVKSYYEKDMSSPDTLSKFISWARKTYWEYNRVGLIIYDHGGGWLGLLQDVTNGNHLMSISKFREAIKDSGVHFNFMMLHACLMSMTEFIYEVRGLTDYLVLSEDTVYSNKWNFEYLMRHAGKAILNETPNALGSGLTPIKLAGFANALYSDDKHYYEVTAIDMSNFDNFYISFNNFALKIHTILKMLDEWSKDIVIKAIINIVNNTIHMHAHVRGCDFYNHSYRDLYNFSTLLLNKFNGDDGIGLRDATEELIESIKDLVIYKNGNEGEHCYGISIFLPDEVWWTLRYDDGTPYSDSFKNIYRYLDFSQQTSWDDFIIALYPEEGGG